MRRIPIVVRATDPVSEAGLMAQLRTSNEVMVFSLDACDRPAVAVVGADRIDEESLCLIRKMHRDGDHRVLVVLTQVDDTALAEAVEAGATSVMRRAEATQAQLISAIRATERGESFISPDLLGRLVDRVRHLQQHVLGPNGMNLSGLSDREVAVLKLLADGYNTSEIAGELAYSERTIKTIIHDVTSRFQLRTRTHAVAYAMRMGLI